MRVLAAIVLLMLFARTAEAACVWVLWTETENSRADSRKNTTDFDRNVYETRDACETALEQEREKVVKHFIGAGARLAVQLPVEHDFFVRLGERIVTVQRHSEWYLIYKYACLPDTIDPRGPKGGAR